MSNICSHNNCLSSKRDGFCGLTKIKVVHGQSFSNVVSGLSKDERSRNGHDSNPTGVSKRQYSKFRIFRLQSRNTPISAHMYKIVVPSAVLRYINFSQTFLHFCTFSSTHTGKRGSGCNHIDKRKDFAWICDSRILPHVFLYLGKPW